MMPRYRTVALLLAQTEIDADSPEEADILFRSMSLDMLEPVEVVNSQLQVAVPARGKGAKPGDIAWEIVSVWTQPDLWAGAQPMGSGADREASHDIVA